MMKKNEDKVFQINISKPEQEYPDIITPNNGEEEVEEDNIAAYSLLSKIEDPYYSNKINSPEINKEPILQEGKLIYILYALI